MGAKEKQDKQRRGQEEGEVCLVSVLGSASVCTTTQIKRSRHTLTVLIRERARGAERGDSEVSETQRERKRQVILLIGSKHMVEPKMCISQQLNSQIIISIQQPILKIDFIAIIELRKLTGHKYLLPVIRGVTVHVFVPNCFGTGLSVRYTCTFCASGTVQIQKSAGINPTQALTRAAAISSCSRVWAVTHRARVNAIILSSVLLVLTRINMTEHLMPHVNTQSVFQLRKDINKTAWK